MKKSIVKYMADLKEKKSNYSNRKKEGRNSSTYRVSTERAKKNSSNGNAAEEMIVCCNNLKKN